MPLMEMQGVNKDYALGKTTVFALKDVDRTLHKGEFAAIYGPSGSGKTTLSNLIGSLDSHTSGKIYRGLRCSTVSGAMSSEFRGGFSTFRFLRPAPFVSPACPGQGGRGVNR